MTDYMQRVIQEKIELDEKRYKLIAFKDTPVFVTLSSIDQEMLNAQSHVMTMYSAILGERISRFMEKTDD